MAEQLNFFGMARGFKVCNNPNKKKKKFIFIEKKEEPLTFDRLKKECYLFIKNKYPRPVECEEYSDYLEMLKEETDLELAHRLHEMAQKIENSIYEPQKKIIQEVYGK